MNIKRINFIFVLFLLIGIFQVGFVFSQEEELIDVCAGDYGITCGDELNIKGSDFELNEKGFFSFLEDGRLIFNQGEENEIVLKGNEGVEVSPLGEINFIQEGGEISINGNKFKNIQSGTENKNAFIKIDSLTREISEAEFWTNENPGNYNINGNQFKVPGNSKFAYNSKGFKLSKGTEIKKISTETYIQGEDLKLWRDDETYDVSGRLNFDEKGNAFIEKGEKAIINDLIISSYKNNVQIYENHCQNNEENFLCFKEDSLFISSTSQGKINLKFSPGNDLLNMKKRKYDKDEDGNLVEFSAEDLKENWLKDENGYRYKEIPDTKDVFDMSIEKGDKIVLENRNDQGLIPKIEQISSKGKTEIQNDGYEFEISGGEVFLKNIKTVSSQDIFNKSYQSVAMEIFSKKGNKIKMNPYRQYIIDSNNNQRISYNKFNLPISNKLEDNSIQTIDQLRLKYPETKFEFPKVVGDIGSSKENKMNEENVPPYMIYLVDQYLSENPSAKNYVKEFQFTDQMKTYHHEGNVLIGHPLVDLQSQSKITFERTREILSPLDVINHEVGHAYTLNYIKERENSILKNSDNALLKKSYESINEIKEKNTNLIEESKKYEVGSEKWEIFRESIQKNNEKINQKQKEIYSILYQNKEEIPLMQKYNEITLKSIQDTFNSENKEKFVESFNPLINNFESDFEKIIKSKGYENFDSYIKENLGASPEEFTTDEKISIYPALSHDELNSKNINKKDKKLLSNYRTSFEKLSFFKDIENKESSKKTLNSLRDYYNSLYNFEENKNLIAQESLDNVFRETTGLPYLYATKDYSEESSFDIISSKFYEVPTIFREQSNSLKKQRINSDNEKISEIYKKLTQIAFDSGEMSVKEYSKLMENCETQNCIERKCIEYKLFCCQEYSNSPNC